MSLCDREFFVGGPSTYVVTKTNYPDKFPFLPSVANKQTTQINFPSFLRLSWKREGREKNRKDSFLFVGPFTNIVKEKEGRKKVKTVFL